MKEMTLSQHLEELRSTVLKVSIILFFSFICTYFFSEEISEFLLKPLREGILGLESNRQESTNGQLINPNQIVYLGILDKVLAQLQVAFWSSIILSSPFWFLQIWGFIKPGLYPQEIRAVGPFFLFGFFLFWAGIIFGQYLVFPVAIKMLLDFGVGNISASISLKDYLILASKILVFLGMIFQFPNLLVVLGFMGIVTKQSLRKMRRYVYLGLALVSAVVTPPDIITMIAVWVPLMLLYELGIWVVAIIVHPNLKRIYS